MKKYSGNIFIENDYILESELYKRVPVELQANCPTSSEDVVINIITNISARV